MNNKPLRFSGTKIKDTLAQQGRREDWLAGQVGVSPSAVNRWSKGSRSISHEHASKVAAALGVPFYLLFDVPIGTDMVPKATSEVIPA